jgi:hypothetical protein
MLMGPTTMVLLERFSLQIHGGISASSNPPINEWEDEQLLINGVRYTKPTVNPVLIESNALKSAVYWIKSLRILSLK